MFSAALLGVVSLGGIGWSMLQGEPGAIQASAPSLMIGENEQGNTASASVIHLVEINTASIAELQLLPGIGPVTAEAIVDDRDKNGRFDTIEDLDRVHGIGPKTIAKLRGRVQIEPDRATITPGG